jgi:hypothetical protein
MTQWSALLPLVMSLAGLALIFGHVATSGGVRETDEGSAAHLWQLLMAVQLPVVGFFAITWLPRAPGVRLAPRSIYVFGTNLREIEFTQCRVFLGVNRSPKKTWPR